MKIERAKRPFTPITLTIETEEELESLLIGTGIGELAYQKRISENTQYTKTNYTILNNFWKKLIHYWNEN